MRVDSIVNKLSRITVARQIPHGKFIQKGKCVAYDLTDEMLGCYKPKHCEDHCECSLVGPPSEAKVVESVKNGDIPVLSIDPKSKDLDIHLHKYDGIIPYTAISQVWSEGFGNPHENRLPPCRLKELASMLDEQRKDTRKALSKE